MQQRIVTNLWFDGQAQEAADFYCSIFPNSRVLMTTRYPEKSPGTAGEIMTVEWELDGQRFVGINGGPQFTFSEAISLMINVETQDELDRYWDALTDGGEEGPCGWLKDRFGLSWQVIPQGMDEVFADADPKKAERAFQAMQQMKKIDIATLRAAADGREVSPAGSGA